MLRTKYDNDAEFDDFFKIDAADFQSDLYALLDLVNPSNEVNQKINALNTFKF